MFCKKKKLREALASLLGLCSVAGRLILNALVTIFKVSVSNQQANWKRWKLTGKGKAAVLDNSSLRSAAAPRLSIPARGDNSDRRVNRAQKPDSSVRCSKRKRPSDDLALMEWYKCRKKNPKVGWRFQLPSSSDLEETNPPCLNDRDTLGMPSQDSLVEPVLKAQGKPVKHPEPIAKLDASAVEIWRKAIGVIGLRPSRCLTIAAGPSRLRRRRETRDKNKSLIPDNHPWFIGIKEDFSNILHGYRNETNLPNPTRTLPLNSVRCPPGSETQGVKNPFKNPPPQLRSSTSQSCKKATAVDRVFASSQR
ncbi:unnamed protein product [Linum trigynum]|uniref:Uncharacterized protein n=1 Tax=Linum trigynum TaxID=586398 RepID=A0AAV2E5I0_9ROSI